MKCRFINKLGINYLSIAFESEDLTKKWSCRTTGEITVSKYKGTGDTFLQIFYSAPYNVEGYIYVLKDGECPSNAIKMHFLSNMDNSTVITYGFSLDKEYVELNKFKNYSDTFSISSQYGTIVSGFDGNITINGVTGSKDFSNICKIDKGDVDVSISGSGKNFDETLICTENITNVKKYIRITEHEYAKSNFLFLEDCLGNAITSLVFSTDVAYIRIISSSFITEMTQSSDLFLLEELNNENLFRITPIDKINQKCILTVRNIDGLYYAIPIEFKN